MSKLFDKWDLDEVKVEDLGLVKYICLDETLVPHTSGRHVKRQFAKSKVSIVERLMKSSNLIAVIPATNNIGHVATPLAMTKAPAKIALIPVTKYPAACQKSLHSHE